MILRLSSSAPAMLEQSTWSYSIKWRKALKRFRISWPTELFGPTPLTWM
jgi:hypothetical protein